ncbi:PKD domain-containing protein, partial [Patescibacteria group bacterium]|nr:PKD domain-containing protein [Patescibacteria group bacterium]MBU4480897.1 PKD domain-containing protein [Patescibacteria group bacterium]
VTAGTNLAPVIDGVTAPTQLKVNEQGTWTINARDPENGPLTYSVRWGDEVLSLTTEQRAFSVGGTASQITTFTHTYNKTGTYTINFTVTDDHQQTAKTSTTIEVVATTPSLTVISPNGGETWERGKTYTISWIGSDVFKEITIGLTNYENYEGGGRGIPAAMHIGTFGGQTRAYGWEITPDIVPGGKYKIRVDGDKFDGTKITDDADNYLSIVSAASTF